jgi:hypothetical protein
VPLAGWARPASRHPADLYRSCRPSHGTVVAYLALFVALAGSSYAAMSITGRDVRDGSLTGGTSAEIR